VFRIMEPKPKRRLREIFLEAAELLDPEARATYLDNACGADVELRKRVESLLAIEKAAGPGAETQVSAEPGFEQPAGERIGHYKLLQKLGEGGCGVVFMAEQTEPIRRRVALKVIKLGMDTKQVIARFEAERQALALMDHPNIAKVFDAGTTESGRPYFVMELVRGTKITDFCDENNLPMAERLNLFFQICQAVQHAHQKGIIHRDLKPSNILVTVNDTVPVPKVIDFGIAKATTGQQLTDKTLFTAYEQFIGTPAYMSPEQTVMTSLDIDTRSDIYSLGVLLYELLTGKTPFDAQDLIRAGFDEMLRTIREREPMRPSTRLSGMARGESTTTAQRRGLPVPELIHLLRGDLDWIVMKALEKDRARRYETANGFAADIKRFLANEPVVARPPTALYRLQKAVRRNKLAFAAASAVATALVLGAVVSSWQAILAFRAKHAADQNAARANTEYIRAQAAEKAATKNLLLANQNLYRADMTLVQQAWENNNLGEVSRLLAETESDPERGFEWYYWQRQTHPEMMTLRGHVEGIGAVCFSPDGRRIASGAGGAESRNSPSPRLGRARDCAKIWDAVTGEELLSLKGHGAGVTSLDFSPDGRRIVTGSWDQTAKVWDATNGQNLLTLGWHAWMISSVAFFRDNKRVITGSWDGTAKIWDATTGTNLLTLRGGRGAIMRLAVSADDGRIVTGNYDGTAQIWDSATGKPLRTINAHSGMMTTAVAFSPDGREIVTGGSAEATAKVWDVTTGQQLLSLKHSEGGEGIYGIVFSLDGKRIATASGDQTAKLWDAASGANLLTWHTGPVGPIAFSPDGQRIITGGDNTLKVWSCAVGRDLPPAGSKAAASIDSRAFCLDGRRILTANLSDGEPIKVWDQASDHELATLKGSRASFQTVVAFSRTGNRIATGGEDDLAKIWDVDSGDELVTLRGHMARVDGIGFSTDGRRVATGSADETAKVWDTATGKLLLNLPGHPGMVKVVAFSPDDQRILTGVEDPGTIKVWNATNGKELLNLQHFALSSGAFSSDGQRIVTGSFKGRVKLWDTTGSNLLAFQAHRGIVDSVAFSPDGHRIVTGSNDGTAKLWEAASGNELLTLKVEPGWTMALFLDAQRIITGTSPDDVLSGSRIKFWQAASPDQVTLWTKQEQIARTKLKAQDEQFDAVLEQDRLRCKQDPGMLKQWLVLLPIEYDYPHESASNALQADRTMDESQLRPKAGEHIKAGLTNLIWRAVQQSDNPIIDFHWLLGINGGVRPGVAYAVTYVENRTAPRNVLLKVACGNLYRIYLNGDPIHQCEIVRAYAPDQDVIPARLKAGINVLVFKVVNEVSPWEGSVRLTDTEGNPLNGINVTLDPEGKESPR
jgi:WD40 repeat protein/serine/threonine protein kinase